MASFYAGARAPSSNSMLRFVQSVKDAKRYISSDSIVLTVLGIACGFVVSVIMGSFTVRAIESETTSFIKTLDWLAVLIGIAVSAVLAAVMCTISLRRIPRFNLVDINRP